MCLDLAPFSIRLENPGFSTNSQGIQLQQLASNKPRSGTGASKMSVSKGRDRIRNR